LLSILFLSFIHSFFYDSLGIFLLLDLLGNVLMLEFFVFNKDLMLSLPFLLFSSIYLFCILTPELDLSDLDELVCNWQNLPFEFEIRFFPLCQVALKDLVVAVHALLTLADCFNHVSGFLSDPFHDALQILNS
jgi:hypothetical protein